MTKRTNAQINSDIMRIVRASETSCTYKEIEEKTGLSYQMIKTSLSSNLSVSKQVQKTLKENKEFKGNMKNYVMDTSIVGIENFRNIIEKICNFKSKIILTSITISELDKINKTNPSEEVRSNARYILNLALNNPNSFKTVLINESLECPDDCIVEYCNINKQYVILLTADKAMALKARMRDIETKYFEISSLRTLLLSYQKDDKLFINALNTRSQLIYVYSNGIEYKNGDVELSIGDDVFIATRKREYISFIHFRIKNTNARNNVESIFHSRICNELDINHLPNSLYKYFIKDFMSFSNN